MSRSECTKGEAEYSVAAIADKNAVDPVICLISGE